MFNHKDLIRFSMGNRPSRQGARGNDTLTTGSSELTAQGRWSPDVD